MEKIHFVGLGGAGCSTVKYISSKKTNAEYSYIDKAKFASVPERVQYLYNQTITKKNKISQYFKNDETIILLGGLGGHTCTDLISYLYKIIKVKCKDVYLVGTTPLDYEKQETKQRAESIIKLMQKEKNFATISNEKYIKEFSALPFTEAFNKIDEIILSKAIEMINK